MLKPGPRLAADNSRRAFYREFVKVVDAADVIIQARPRPWRCQGSRDWSSRFCSVLGGARCLKDMVLGVLWSSCGPERLEVLGPSPPCETPSGAAATQVSLVPCAPLKPRGQIT